MLGRIIMEQGRHWRVTSEKESILGLRLCKVTVPWSGRTGQMKRAARLLTKLHVGRVLVPLGFEHWAILKQYGLSPVSTEDFCKSMGAPLALAALQRIEVPESRATVALRGERVTRPMRMAALALCPRVRTLIVSAPTGGEALQAELRREFGVPTLEEGRRIPDVAVHFSEMWGTGQVMLRLYGEEPDLAGLRIACGQEAFPTDCEELPLMAVLWESGKLKNGASEIVVADG